MVFHDALSSGVHVWEVIGPCEWSTAAAEEKGMKQGQGKEACEKTSQTNRDGTRAMHYVKGRKVRSIGEKMCWYHEPTVFNAWPHQIQRTSLFGKQLTSTVPHHGHYTKVPMHQGSFDE